MWVTASDWDGSGWSRREGQNRSLLCEPYYKHSMGIGLFWDRTLVMLTLGMLRILISSLNYIMAPCNQFFSSEEIFLVYHPQKDEKGWYHFIISISVEYRVRQNGRLLTMSRKSEEKLLIDWIVGTNSSPFLGTILLPWPHDDTTCFPTPWL